MERVQSLEIIQETQLIDCNAKHKKEKNTITYTLILDTAAVPIKHVTVSCTTEGYTEQLGPKGNTKEDVWFEPLQRHRLYRNFQWFSSVS